MARKSFSLFDLVLFFGLISLPFPWLILLKVGGSALKPIHVVLVFAATLALFEKKRSAWRGLFLGYGSLFTWLYGLYLLWYIVRAMSAADAAALSFLFEQAAYFLGFLSFTLLVSRTVRRGWFSAIAAFAGWAGVWLFAGYMTMAFAREGRFLWREIYEALVTINATGLRRTFSFLFNLTAPPVSFSSSLRHQIVQTFILFMVFMIHWLETTQNGVGRWLMWPGVFLCIVLVIISASRSGVLILGMIGILAFLTRAGIVRHRTFIYRTLAAGLASAALLILALWTSPSLAKIFSSTLLMLQNRIAALSDDPRLIQYENTLDEINRNLFWGYGIGKTVSQGSGNFLGVHNVFLASWVETGLPGAFLSFAWYGAILWCFLTAWRKYAPERSETMSVWILMIPIIPLFQPLISGGGAFTAVSWISLAGFFGFMQGQKIGQAAQSFASRDAQHPSPPATGRRAA